MKKSEILSLFLSTNNSDMKVFVVDTLPANPIEYAISNSSAECRANMYNGKLYILTQGECSVGTELR